MPDYFQPINSTFCEGRVIGLHFLGGGTTTEVVNTLSSLFLLFHGAWGLYRTGKKEPLVFYLNSLLMVNGIGSTLYHATFYFGFGIIDSFSMTTMMMIGLVAIADEVVDERKAEIGKQRWWLSSTITFIVCIYGIITMTMDAANANPSLFRVLFALPFIFIVISLVYVYINDVTKRIIIPGTETDRQAVRDLVVRALVSGLGGFFLWILDQVLCDPLPGIVYIFGHGWWHLGISYCALCLFSFVSFLRADNFGYKPTISYFPASFPIWPQVAWSDLKREMSSTRISISPHHVEVV